MATGGLVGDELLLVELWVLCLVSIDAVLDLSTELTDEALNGPCSSISEGTDGVTFDLV